MTYKCTQKNAQTTKFQIKWHKGNTPCQETTDQEVELSATHEHSPCPLLPPYLFPSTTLPQNHLYPDLCDTKSFSCFWTLYKYLFESALFLWNICDLSVLIACSNSSFILISVWYSIIWRHHNLPIGLLRNIWVFF